MLPQGKRREAVPLLEHVAEASAKQSGPTHWRTAEAKVVLARALTATGDVRRAEPLLRDAVAALEPQAQAQPRLLARARQALSEVTR